MPACVLADAHARNGDGKCASDLAPQEHTDDLLRDAAHQPAGAAAVAAGDGARGGSTGGAGGSSSSSTSPWMRADQPPPLLNGPTSPAINYSGHSPPHHHALPHPSTPPLYPRHGASTTADYSPSSASPRHTAHGSLPPRGGSGSSGTGGEPGMMMPQGASPLGRSPLNLGGGVQGSGTGPPAGGGASPYHRQLGSHAMLERRSPGSGSSSAVSSAAGNSSSGGAVAVAVAGQAYLLDSPRAGGVASPHTQRLLPATSAPVKSSAADPGGGGPGPGPGFGLGPGPPPAGGAGRRLTPEAVLAGGGSGGAPGIRTLRLLSFGRERGGRNMMESPVDTGGGSGVGGGG